MSYIKVDPERYSYVFSPYNKPTARCASGDTLFFQCKNTFTDRLKEGDRVYPVDGLDFNPMFGPVFVEDAEPGDTLKITIEKIEITGDALMWLQQDNSLMFQQFFDLNRTIRVPIDLEKKEADLFGNKLPIKPLIGCLAVSPLERTRTVDQGNYFGNIDCKLMTEGSVLYVPVQVKGGLIQTGDIHALQGDGEIVCGLECPGNITLKVELIKGISEAWPILEKEDRWYVVAACEDMLKACQACGDTMIKFLSKRQNRYEIEELIYLSSICGDLEICEIIDTYQAIRFGIDKSVLPDIRFDGLM